MLLLAGDLLLLAPEYARSPGRTPGDAGHPALGAAVLAELALLGRVEVRRAARGRPARFDVVAGPEGLDPVLGERLALVHDAPASDVTLAQLAWGLPGPLTAQLHELGLVAPQTVVARGAAPYIRLDTPYIREVVDRLERVILNGPDGDPEAGALAGLLGICDAVNAVIRLPGMPPKEIRRRALLLSRSRPGDASSDVLHAACVALATGAFTS